jgi:surface polysaccharide O-acyltransferase-like enzyme
MLFIANPLMAQMWYMPMIIGIYLAIPFINMMIRNLPERKLLFIPMALIIVSCSIAKLNNIMMIRGGNPINMQIDTSFAGFFFGFYLFAGYLMAHAPEELTLHQRRWASALALTSIPIGLVANTLGELFFYNHAFFKANFLWYDSPFIMITSLGVFWLIRCHTQRNIVLKPFALLSQYSFPIFFLHYFVLLALRRLIPGLPGWSTPLQVVTLLILTLVISCGLSWLLTRNATMGHVLFNFRRANKTVELAHT